jgi:hypothetical protein
MHLLTFCLLLCSLLLVLVLVKPFELTIISLSSTTVVSVVIPQIQVVQLEVFLFGSQFHCTIRLADCHVQQQMWQQLQYVITFRFVWQSASEEHDTSTALHVRQ